jgi:hypothetical protein
VLLLDSLGRSSNGLVRVHVDLYSFDIVAIECQALVFADFFDGRLCI